MQILLQHVSIPRPPDEESAQLARRFYTDVVGLIEKPVPTSIAHLGLIWFRLGEETELHVFTEAKDVSASTSGRHFCLQVSDVAGLHQRLTDEGYETWSPEEIPGRPRFFCRDPFGNTIEFTQITDNYLKYQAEE